MSQKFPNSLDKTRRMNKGRSKVKRCILVELCVATKGKLATEDDKEHTKD